MKNLKKLFVLMIVCAISVCTFTACSNEEEDVREVSVIFLESLINMDFETAREYCDRGSDARETVNDIASEMEDVEVESSKELTASEYEIWEIKFSQNGEYATVEYSLTNGYGSEYEDLKMKLVKDEGAWKVKDFDFQF